MLTCAPTKTSSNDVGYPRQPICILLDFRSHVAYIAFTVASHIQVNIISTYNVLISVYFIIHN